MAEQRNEIDPRVRRTRQLILQAFNALLHEKSLKDISVQDITERATINRGTFYAHFEDKYALIDRWIRGEFLRVLAQYLPTSTPLSAESLYTLTFTVFHFLGEIHQGHSCKPSDRQQYDPLLETAIQQQIAQILLTWLQQAPGTELKTAESLETRSLIISWAIFGPAVQWSHGNQDYSAEYMARAVTRVVSTGLASSFASFAGVPSQR